MEEMKNKILNLLQTKRPVTRRKSTESIASTRSIHSPIRECRTPPCTVGDNNANKGYLNPNLTNDECKGDEVGFRLDEDVVIFPKNSVRTEIRKILVKTTVKKEHSQQDTINTTQNAQDKSVLSKDVNATSINEKKKKKKKINEVDNDSSKHGQEDNNESALEDQNSKQVTNVEDLSNNLVDKCDTTEDEIAHSDDEESFGDCIKLHLDDSDVFIPETQVPGDQVEETEVVSEDEIILETQNQQDSLIVICDDEELGDCLDSLEKSDDDLTCDRSTDNEEDEENSKIMEIVDQDVNEIDIDNQSFQSNSLLTSDKPKPDVKPVNNQQIDNEYSEFLENSTVVNDVVEDSLDGCEIVEINEDQQKEKAMKNRSFVGQSTIQQEIELRESICIQNSSIDNSQMATLDCAKFAIERESDAINNSGIVEDSLIEKPPVNERTMKKSLLTISVDNSQSENVGNDECPEEVIPLTIDEYDGTALENNIGNSHLDSDYLDNLDDSMKEFEERLKLARERDEQNKRQQVQQQNENEPVHTKIEHTLEVATKDTTEKQPNEEAVEEPVEEEINLPATKAPTHNIQSKIPQPKLKPKPRVIPKLITPQKVTNESKPSSVSSYFNKYAPSKVAPTKPTPASVSKFIGEVSKCKEFKTPLLGKESKVNSELFKAPASVAASKVSSKNTPNKFAITSKQLLAKPLMSPNLKNIVSPISVYVSGPKKTFLTTTRSENSSNNSTPMQIKISKVQSPKIKVGVYGASSKPKLVEIKQKLTPAVEKYMFKEAKIQTHSSKGKAAHFADNTLVPEESFTRDSLRNVIDAHRLPVKK